MLLLEVEYIGIPSTFWLMRSTSTTSLHPLPSSVVVVEVLLSIMYAPSLPFGLCRPLLCIPTSPWRMLYVIDLGV